ncbi:hypothetical protein OH77DRAFT_168593 [Trametes cingulata]|nr:hypothetical protein OH77DRAFT_168593 [Trametes cingulata]
MTPAGTRMCLTCAVATPYRSGHSGGSLSVLRSQYVTTHGGQSAPEGMEPATGWQAGGVRVRGPGDTANCLLRGLFASHLHGVLVYGASRLSSGKGSKSLDIVFGLEMGCNWETKP